MRRLIVMCTVAVLAITGFAAVVRADAPRTPAANQDAAVTAARLELPELGPVPRVPAYTCDPNAPVEKYMTCLNRYLNKLSSSLNSTIAELQRTQADLYSLYDCFLAVPVTPYMGYLYGSPTAPIQTTALDYTEDPNTQSFDFFAVIDPACVAP